MKKRFKINLSILMIPVSVISLGILFYIYRPVIQYFLFSKQDKNFFYNDFGFEVPKDYSVYGIDISHYQQKIDWKAVSRMEVDNIKIQFAFMKASEGDSFKDKRFFYNWEKAKKNNILRGAYHFFRPNIDAKAQAEHFISVLNLEKGDLPPVLDIETIDDVQAEDLRKSLQVWLDIVHQYYQVKPIIYTNLSFYKKYLQGNFEEYPLWIAYYHYEKPYLSERNFHFWQFTSKSRINGIGTEVDMNVFNFNYEDLKALCKK